MTQETELSQKSINLFRTAMKRKTSIVLIVTGNTNKFYVNLDSTIELDDNIDYEIALRRFDCYNSIYNVTATNNNFYYFNGTANRTIIIIPGAYDVGAINTEIQRQMKLLGDVTTVGNQDTFSINLYPNLNTLKSIITLANSYTVDFTKVNSLRLLLGFDSLVLNAAYNQSTNIINIQVFNNILITTDLCSGSYINSKSSQTIYSLSSNPVQVGYKIIVEPSPPIYLPMIKKQFNNYSVTITDENSNDVSFNGETVSMVFHIQSV